MNDTRMEDLYDKLRDAATRGNLVHFRLKLFPPNGKTTVSMRDTPVLRFDEVPDPDGEPLQRHPIQWEQHRLRNYYFLRKLGESSWVLIGESDDYLNMWEIEYETGRLAGPGTYVVKAIMVADVDERTFYGENVVFFEVV